jgi:hypothetical protein
MPSDAGAPPGGEGLWREAPAWARAWAGSRGGVATTARDGVRARARVGSLGVREGGAGAAYNARGRRRTQGGLCEDGTTASRGGPRGQGGASLRGRRGCGRDAVRVQTRRAGCGLANGPTRGPSRGLDSGGPRGGNPNDSAIKTTGMVRSILFKPPRHLRTTPGGAAGSSRAWSPLSNPTVLG